MRKPLLALIAFVAFVLPGAADAAPKHHDQAPVSRRAIDWD